MSDWLNRLSFPAMAALVAVATFLVTLTIHRVVLRLATGDRLKAFKGFSPGMLPPLGIIFALLVGFIAAQVWSDADRARIATNHEASALRQAVILASAFPGDTEGRLRGLIHGHIETVVSEEWPAMAHQQVTLTMIPANLSAALEVALGLRPEGPGQVAAQRELVTAFQTALDARRQRIILSRSTVDWVKWSGLVLQAVLTLVAIAFVHSDNRTTSALALGTFATAAALAMLLIVSHRCPFAGPVAVRPDVLLQVMPEDGSRQ